MKVSTSKLLVSSFLILSICAVLTSSIPTVTAAGLGEVYGIVYDGADPTPNATVDLYIGSTWKDDDITDEDGTFSVGCIIQGRTTFKVVASKSGHPNDTEYVVVYPSQSIQQNLNITVV